MLVTVPVNSLNEIKEAAQLEPVILCVGDLKWSVARNEHGMWIARGPSGTVYHCAGSPSLLASFPDIEEALFLGNLHREVEFSEALYKA